MITLAITLVWLCASVLVLFKLIGRSGSQQDLRSLARADKETSARHSSFATQPEPRWVEMLLHVNPIADRNSPQSHR
jgi:hypothetical protein